MNNLNVYFWILIGFRMVAFGFQLNEAFVYDDKGELKDFKIIGVITNVVLTGFFVWLTYMAVTE